MHYHNSQLLKSLNALIDFLLIVAAFFLSGLLRVISPFGATFSMRDVYQFMPMSVLYAAVMVMCYWAEGGYHSLRIRIVKRELIKVFVTDLIGFALVATFLYILQLSQFSRLLLVFFYILSVVVIVVKRYAFDRIADWYVRKHNIETRVVIVGSGPMARRFYKDVLSKHAGSMRCVGYMADTKADDLKNYLGKTKDFHDILENTQVDLVVVAEETQNRRELQNLVSIADAYHIRMAVIPVYNDFVSGRTEFSVINGIHLVDVALVDTCDIMGVHIVVTDMEKTLNLIGTQLEDWRGKYICVANVHTTVTAHGDADYMRIQNGAVMALPDGGPLSQYSREKGYQGAQRVTGPDLMKEILARSAEKGWRNYFYGSTQETLDLLRKKIEERYPGAPIAGMMSPPFRDLTPREDAEIVKQINATNPDFVWVGLGAPKQERWMAAHDGRVHALMVGVGAAFDYEAGNIKRAPKWMQKMNLEWLYRLMQDPKRLFKRYFETNTKFLLWKWRQ